MKLLHRLLPASILLLLSISLQAQAEQWYHVELIVFENLNTMTDEQWPEYTEPQPASLTPAMATSIIQPASTQSLSTTQQRLSRSSQYRVHYYRAWNQPILSKWRAKSVAVTSGSGLLDGTIRLYKATYLHADLNLWLKQASEVINTGADNATGPDISHVRYPNLNQLHRIRSKQLHYFDHPRLGALLELTPIDTPDAAVEAMNSLESYSLPPN